MSTVRAGITHWQAGAGLTNTLCRVVRHKSRNSGFRRVGHRVRSARDGDSWVSCVSLPRWPVCSQLGRPRFSPSLTFFTSLQVEERDVWGAVTSKLGRGTVLLQCETGWAV